MRSISRLAALLLMFGAVAASDDPIARIESRLDANDPVGAVALGEQAVRSFPDDSALWLTLGEAYAIDALREALRLRPGHSQAKSELRRLGG